MVDLSDCRIAVKSLGSLPIVAHFARRLGIEETIDRHCPSRSNAHLTHGQVALAIVLNRLTQPRGLYRVIDWARDWALREVCEIDGDGLNDDRLARCLDAIYPQLNCIQGEVALAAVREFDLKLDQLHGDVTSIVLQGEYPEYEQEPAADDPSLAPEPPPPHPRYGYGGQRDCKQFRVLEIGSLDGMVPLWHRTQDGNKADVGTVINEMTSLQKHVPVPGCAIVGDSKLLTQALLPRLRANGWDFLAPLPRNPAIDRDYLALPQDDWVELDYCARRSARKPKAERSRYIAQEVQEEWTNPETGEVEQFRKLYVRSSALGDQQKRLRLNRIKKAAEELNQLMKGLPKRARQAKAATVEARALSILERFQVRSYFTIKVTAGKPFPLLEWESNQEEMDQAARLDGYYVLYTSILTKKATAIELLRRWKEQGELERRFSDWKGPLHVRPVYLKTPKRIAALILLLHLALMIFCLIEREARRRLEERGQTKLPNLLAGHVAAVPTGENLLRAFENLLLVVVEGGHRNRESRIERMRPEHHAIWDLLSLGSPSWA